MNIIDIFKHGFPSLGKGLTSALLLVLLSLPLQASAGSASQGAENLETITGTFDGVDLKQQYIWISDHRFNLDRAVRVKGTSTKLGLLNDIKQGEEIKAVVKPNEAQPSSPYVIAIERQ